jgi:uncharacterized protein
MVRNIEADWALEYSFYLGSQFNYWGAPMVSLGYVGLVMLLVKSVRWDRAKGWLAAVGRTALSNYLLQTIICTTIFYGHGFGFFGSVERTGQIAIVVAVWLVSLTLTNLWVKRFRFGPFEWVWRSATYGRRQPMKLGSG